MKHYDLTRRQALQSVAAAAFVVGSAGLLSACGSSGVAPTTTTDPASRKRGGVVRVGVPQQGPIDPDPLNVTNEAAVVRVQSIHDFLVWPEEPGKFTYRLAEEITSNDIADVWTVRLRSGVTSHAGKPLTADDVIATVRRMFAPPATASSSSLPFLAGVDLKKLDDRTVQFHLATPFSEFPLAMGSPLAPILPADFNAGQPDGFGPFTHTSFSQSAAVMGRFDGYYGTPAVIDRLELKFISDPDAMMNGLLGGQLEIMRNLSATQARTLGSNPQFTQTVGKGATGVCICMRTDLAPFSDVRVRQALRLVTDRKQIVEQTLNGNGVIANDISARPGTPGYASSLPQRVQDFDQAKSLLRQAGQSDLTVTLFTAPIINDIVEASTVYVEQARGAGISVNLQKLDPSNYYGDQYLKYPLSMDAYAAPMSYLSQAQFYLLKDAPFNQTHFADDEFAKLYDLACRTVDEAKRNDVIAQMQTIEYDRGGYVVPHFADAIDAAKAGISGLKPRTNAYTAEYNLLSVSS